MTDPAETVVTDASVLIELLADGSCAVAAAKRLSRTVLHAPAHVDAEVLSALGRMYRAGNLTADEVDQGLAGLQAIPMTRHPLAELLPGAWARRDRLRLVDAMYVELAIRLDAPMVTTDYRLARACRTAEAVSTS